jgi:zinc protease
MLKILNAPAPFKGTEVHTLSNGLTLILKEDHRVPVVALQVWARCGAIDEHPSVYGISHGLEHMVFKGTPTRSAGEITRSIEANGGSINAATQLETTHYYIDVPSYGADTALDVLVDTILNPTFPQEELERERLVILEEIHRRDDSPDATLWDEFASHVFHGTPYGIKVIGSIETVSNLSRNDLNNYFRAHYVPEKLTVVAAGDFSAKKWAALLEKKFGGMKKQKAPAIPAIQNGVTPERRIELRRPVQMSYLAMGFPSISFGDPDSVALDIVADIIGGSASSRLNQRIREEKQLALGVSCDYMPFGDSGLFAVFGEMLPEKINAATEAIQSELKEVESNPFTSAELARAKARIKSEWLQGSETAHGQASTLGNLASLGHLPVIESYLNRVNELTTDELMSVFNKHIAGKNFWSTLLLPNLK